MQTRTRAADFTLTDEERALLPSDEDVAHYAEHGWYLSKKLLTDAEVDTLLEASERFYAWPRGWPKRTRSGCSSRR